MLYVTLIDRSFSFFIFHFFFNRWSPKSLPREMLSEGEGEEEEEEEEEAVIAGETDLDNCGDLYP